MINIINKIILYYFISIIRLILLFDLIIIIFFGLLSKIQFQEFKNVI